MEGAVITTKWKGYNIIRFFPSCVPVTTQARSSVRVIMAGQSEVKSEGQSWCFYVCGDVKECFVVSAAIVSVVASS